MIFFNFSSGNVFLVLEKEPRIIFKIAICTEDFQETQDGLCCDLVFTFPIKYPDEAPIIAIEEDNFEDEMLNEKLLDSMKASVEENMGTEMIFTLVAGAQELLNVLFDGIKNEREEKKLRKEQEAEEAERKRFEGTRVSWLEAANNLEAKSCFISGDSRDFHQVAQ